MPRCGNLPRLGNSARTARDDAPRGLRGDHELGPERRGDGLQQLAAGLMLPVQEPRDRGSVPVADAPRELRAGDLARHHGLLDLLDDVHGRVSSTPEAGLPRGGTGGAWWRGMNHETISRILLASPIVAESAPKLRKRASFGVVPANMATGFSYAARNGVVKHITGCNADTAQRIAQIERASWLRPHMDVNGRRIISEVTS